MAPLRGRISTLATITLLCAAASVAGCSDDATPEGSGGTAGSGMTIGNAGKGGTGQAGLSSGGNAGTSGASGMAGAGMAGSSGGGAGGSAGGAGAGNGGAGMAGTSGNGGGNAGSAGGGNGGASGGGTAGTGGAGAGGAGAGGMAGGGAGGAGNGGTGGSGEFTLSSPAFESLEGCGPDDDAEACDVFPVDNTRFGEDVSPELNWTNPPAGTQSYAIVFQDLSNGFAHWVMWNIPAELTSLPAELPTGPMPSMPAGASQASFRPDEAFTGSGACGNVYEFVLYALSDETISPTMTADQTAVRTFVQDLDSILGETSMRARSAEPECVP